MGPYRKFLFGAIFVKNRGLNADQAALLFAWQNFDFVVEYVWSSVFTIALWICWWLSFLWSILHTHPYWAVRKAHCPVKAYVKLLQKYIKQNILAVAVWWEETDPVIFVSKILFSGSHAFPGQSTDQEWRETWKDF